MTTSQILEEFFDQKDWDCLRDVVYTLTGKIHRQTTLEYIFRHLPTTCQLTAMECGMGDIDWRRDVIKYYATDKRHFKALEATINAADWDHFHRKLVLNIV